MLLEVAILIFVGLLLEPHLSVDDDDELEDEKSESNEHETENLTTSVGDNETLLDIFGAFFGCSNISVHGDSHSDVASQDGGKSTNNERGGCVASTEGWFNCEEKECTERNDKNCKIDILLS